MRHWRTVHQRALGGGSEIEALAVGVPDVKGGARFHHAVGGGEGVGEELLEQRVGHVVVLDLLAGALALVVHVVWRVGDEGIDDVCCHQLGYDGGVCAVSAYQAVLAQLVDVTRVGLGLGGAGAVTLGVEVILLGLLFRLLFFPWYVDAELLQQLRIQVGQLVGVPFSEARVIEQDVTLQGLVVRVLGYDEAGQLGPAVYDALVAAGVVPHVASHDDVLALEREDLQGVELDEEVRIALQAVHQLAVCVVAYQAWVAWQVRDLAFVGLDLGRVYHDHLCGDISLLFHAPVVRRGCTRPPHISGCYAVRLWCCS